MQNIVSGIPFSTSPALDSKRGGDVVRLRQTASEGERVQSRPRLHRGLVRQQQRERRRRPHRLRGDVHLEPQDADREALGRRRRGARRRSRRRHSRRRHQESYTKSSRITTLA